MTKRQIIVVGFVASALVLAVGCVRALSAGHVVLAVATAATAILLLTLASLSGRFDRRSVAG